MLQRIYGTAFPTPEELDDYLKMLEEAEKRDHRRLGKDWTVLDSGGGRAGAGALASQGRARAQDDRGLLARRAPTRAATSSSITPHIARQDLWETSGHLDFFARTCIGRWRSRGPVLIKPMNCPFHLLIYKSRVRSYRELPIRWAELGTVIATSAPARCTA